MKKLSLILFLSTSLIYSQNKFTKGVNLTGWFQENIASEIQFGKYTKQDFINIKLLGCDIIRLPINLHFMTDGAPNYNLDPIFLYFLDSAVTWAEQLNLNLILDNHSSDSFSGTSSNIVNTLIPVWQHMAEHFKNRSKLISYEILNEPNGISRSLWNSTQQAVINAIRQIDTVHTIIVGGTSWNTYNELAFLPIYSDENLIYTFHFYDPFLFTHQGADWTAPTLTSLSGIPYPYNASRMPALPSQFNGTWIQSAYNSYNTQGTIEYVKSLIDIADKFQKQRNVTLFCGEFGVFMQNSIDADRIEWYRQVREYLDEKGIAWSTWDYQNGFGLFKKGTEELFDYDLNVSLLDALGLNQVPQKELIIKPDSSNIFIYVDKIEPGINSSSNFSDGILSFSNEESVRSGKFSIFWTNANQYNYVNFNFVPNKDFTYIKQNNYVLHVSVKGDTPNSKFDIRFIDTKTSDPNDHPWRMRYTVNEQNSGGWDNTWHDLEIPLSSFREHGSWDNNQWYEPIGAFDWSRIDEMDFVSEENNLIGKKFWFDDIYISSATVDVKNEYLDYDFNLSQNYPNPFNPTTTIKYTLPQTEMISKVKLIVYDVLGRTVRTLVDKVQNPGIYEVNFEGRDLTSGIYFYTLQYGKYFKTNKMILVK